MSVALEIIGSAPAWREATQLALELAELMLGVHIQGASGTGKEVVAKMVADLIFDGQIVTVNCSSIPPELFESEFFGYERGSHSAAAARKKGFFELAEGGVLFLDEVADIAPQHQAKLLRVLESGDYWPVGATTSKTADVFVVSATHKDLWAEVEAGRFREDLYYRLIATEVVRLPELNERREDIPALARHLLTKDGERSIGGRCSPTPLELSDSACEALAQGDYSRGNVRALRKAVRGAWIRARREGAEKIEASHVLLKKVPKGPAEMVLIAVLKLTEERGWFRRRDIDELLQMPTPTVKKKIKALLVAGKVEKRGKGAATMYRAT